MKATLLVSAANPPATLALTCAALERQSWPELEIFFCEDGAESEVAQVVAAFQSRARFSVRHFTQEGGRFRKGRVMNAGAREASGEVLVFLDGDCVPHRDYVADHMRATREGRYLAGRRVELGPMLSRGLTPQKVRAGYFDFPRPSLVWSALRGDSENLQRTVRVPWPWARRILKMASVVDLKGCNYSVLRSDFAAINGYDESYEGYGREDTDVEIRLQNHGLKIHSMKGLALQFHVWHPRREFTPSNDARLEELRRSRRVRCEQGLAK